MTESAFQKEPRLPRLAQDFINFPVSLMDILVLRYAAAGLPKQGEDEASAAYVLRMGNEPFRKHIGPARQERGGNVISLAYWFFNPQSPQRLKKEGEIEALKEELAQSPQHVAAVNAAVQILNTTTDVAAFVKAHNDILSVIRDNKAPEPFAQALPKRAIKKPGNKIDGP